MVYLTSPMIPEKSVREDSLLDDFALEALG